MVEEEEGEKEEASPASKMKKKKPVTEVVKKDTSHAPDLLQGPLISSHCKSLQQQLYNSVNPSTIILSFTR